MWHILIFALFIWVGSQQIYGQTCPSVSTTFSGSLDATTNTFDTNLALFTCQCSDDPETMSNCLSKDGGITPTWHLILQDDTHDYKWYPAWEQDYDNDGEGNLANLNANCTLLDRVTQLDWTPTEGYNATSKFALTSRCNIAASYCLITGHDCITNEGDDLLMTAFNVKGVACTDDFNGEPFWGIANVLVQWKEYEFEQCWVTSDATLRGSSHSGSGDQENGATQHAPALEWYGTHKICE